MSLVTDVVLITPLVSHQTITINTFMDCLRSCGFHISLDDPEWAEATPLIDVAHSGGGNKYMQCSVWIGALNYLDVALMVRTFLSLKWYDYWPTLLLYHYEHDDAWVIVKSTDKNCPLDKAEKL